MRGELLSLSVILRKFYINKPFWLIGIFGFLFACAEFSRNFVISPTVSRCRNKQSFKHILTN